MKPEKGILKITPTRRGWAAVVLKENGRTFTITNWSPQDDAHNGKACTMYTENNKLIELKLVTPEEVLFTAIEVVHRPPVGGNRPAPEPQETFTDSFDMQNVQWSKETMKAMQGFRGIDNFYLKFYKAARLEKDGDKLKFQHFKADRDGVVYCIQANFGTTDCRAIADRSTQAAQSMGFDAKSDTLVTFEASSKWRWVTGLGNASVYENGMTLHHVYGIPYIPGSGVKGMLRTWIITACFAGIEDDAVKNEVFQKIFGCPSPDKRDDGGKKGQAIFFDAFPTEKPIIEPDVMNNHFQDYYERKTPPADWLNPNPIFFMTVRKSKIRFLVGLVHGGDAVGADAGPLLPARLSHLSAASTLTQLVQTWLLDALENHGIGAKTAVGYGQMTVALP